MKPPPLLIAALAALVSGQALAEKLPLPKASYSADITYETDGRTYSGRINVDGYKERRDVRDAAGRDSVKIIRRDLGKLIELRPQRNAAVELRIAAAEAAGEIGAPAADIDSFYGADVTPQGHETVAGLATTKYHVDTETSPGLKIDALIWSTDDGIIVRIEGKASVEGGNQLARVELSNITRGPQDPGLFEAPQGMTVISPDAISTDAPDGKSGSADQPKPSTSGAKN